MTHTFSIDQIDQTRPLGLPLRAEVQGLLWTRSSSAILSVPHEALVADVPSWLVAEADWRAAGPYASLLTGLPASVRDRETKAICSVLATGDRLHPDLPLGVSERTAIAPWLVRCAFSTEAYVLSLITASVPCPSFTPEDTSFILDVREGTTLYLGELLRAHAAYLGGRVRAALVSNVLLRELGATRRITEVD